MDIKKISEKNGVSKFLVKGTNVVFMNSLRRTIMESVPVLAIENVSIYDNSSVIFDEMLCHRIAMLPIKTDLKDYKLGDKVKLVLEKEGPCTVYSKDIKSTDPKIEVVNKQVPLVKLKKDQAVKMELEAIMDTGKTHSKWQPAVVSYYEVPVLTQKKEVKNAEEFLKHAPQGWLDVKAGKFFLKDPYETQFSKEFLEKISDKNLSLEFEKDNFVLVIESHGGLTAKEIMDSAADVLIEKIGEFQKGLKSA